MHTVVMKYFRYDMRCIVDRWNLSVRIFLHLVAGEVVRSYLLNVYGLLGQSDQ